MKKTLYLFGALAMSFMTIACDSYENLIPSQYNCVLSLKEFGEQELILYATGSDTKYEITTMKTGAVPETATSAYVVPMSEAAFEQYNLVNGKEYKYLSPDCYTVSGTELVYGENEFWKKTIVSIDFEKTADLVRSAKGEYAIPMQLYTEGQDSVNVDKSTLIIRLSDVISPVVSIGGTKTYGLQKAGGQIELPVSLQIDNEWAFSVTAEIVRSSFEGVTLENGGVVTFEPGSQGKLLINMPELNTPRGNITLKLTQIDGMGFEINTEEFEISAAAEIKLEPSMLKTNAQEATEGFISNLVDGNIATYFHTSWSANIPAPHWVQVTLKEPVSVFAFTYVNRQANGNASMGQLTIQAGMDEDSLVEIDVLNADEDGLPRGGAGVYDSKNYVLDNPVKVVRYLHTGLNPHYGVFFVWSELNMYGF